MRKAFGGSGRLVPWVLFAVVVISRLALLPRGPWEQDEVLFAAGVVDFDVTRHRPHPPGFPVWIVIGKLFAGGFGEALRGLQIASSISSGVTVVLLAAVLRRFMPASAATLAALSYAALPLIWIHSHRGFSTTPAMMFASLSVWLWLRENRRTRPSVLPWLASAAATAVRPQLLPLYLMISILALVQCPTRRQLAIGITSYVAAVAVIYLAMVVDSGGVAAVYASATSHVHQHGKVLGGSTPIAGFGLVRALGGVVPAVVGLGLCAAGMAVPFFASGFASIERQRYGCSPR